MKEYFEGKKLYGNDFSHDQIMKWYHEETEAFGNLVEYSYGYSYHMMNRIHGFNKIKNNNFKNVLGFGSAWGLEFMPIIDKIGELTIIEPSEHLVSTKIGNVIPKYLKPNVGGNLDLLDNSFDLITCFGALHHIPNVSFVLSELIRVLKPNSHLLIREPIISMGDWREPRNGLTKNERGIPLRFFENELKQYALEIISKEYCFTNTRTFERLLGFLFKAPIYSYKFYVKFDAFISGILKKNVPYHATNKINKIGPQSIFYVLKKH